MNVIDTGLPTSSPGHLGSALPHQRGAGQGSAGGRVSALERCWAGVVALRQVIGRAFPLLGARPSAEEMLLVLVGLDQAERDSAFALYSGLKNPHQHMTYVYELRRQCAIRLDELGWHKEADLVRERINRETAQ